MLPSNSWFWSDDWEDQIKCTDFLSFAQCEGVLALKQLGGTRYTWYGALTGSGIYSVTDYAAPLGASSCGFFGAQEMTPGLPYQKNCQNVVYYPTNDELLTETCQIEAYAAFTDWSSAVLPIQFVDSDYYVMRDLEGYTQPSVTSTGGAALAITVGLQPLLDSFGIMSLTAGISNAGAGDITNIHMMYMFVPKELTLNSGGSPDVNNACTSDVWSCGGSGNCDVSVAHCGICGCPADHICSSSNLAKCESITTSPGTCSDNACDCGDDLVYEDLCASGGSCTCYIPTGSSVNASSCNILDTLLGTAQSNEFTSECNALANDYHVCVLSPEEIAEYTLYNCPVDLENSVELSDNDLRKSYIARLDAFYDYELSSAISVTGTECG
jgi:hypothetical protein